MSLQNLKAAIIEYFHLKESDEQIACIPAKYQKHQNCIIFKSDDFAHPYWKSSEAELWEFVCKFCKVEKIAVQSFINNDGFRSPNCTLVIGTDPWVIHRDNGIKYCFNITKSMFCFGNISEKIRVSKFDCSEEVVVDLFAGIGYFTLPFLVHAKAKFLYACEWNPASCEALRRSLVLNKADNRCQVLEGDNRKVCPANVADRINLGLIPECSEFYEAACRAIKLTGGILHVHRNVLISGINKELGSMNDANPNIFCSWTPRTDCDQKCLQVGMSICHELTGKLLKVKNYSYHVGLQNVCKVKNYAPHIQHFVFDIHISQ
ncbi:tRNA wybutosine-synthesizing protein 2 homolog [Symsagittifera roscoffensis]|uniref:tRNA wybutosine-synthesizing protein 2 homolog n=1 Tax=Symsagittifera roscoffensis TaxID=84072 RepID=UPI00307BB65F